MGSYKGRTGSDVSRASGGTPSHDKAEEMKETPLVKRRGPSKVDTGKPVILSAYPLDASDMELPDERGGKMGGSTENVAHSLKGASVVSR